MLARLTAVVAFVGGIVLAACAPAATPTPTPVPTPTPTPWREQESTTTPWRLDLGNGVVAAFEWYNAQDRGATLTHVPSGAQAALDGSGRVLERLDGRGDGNAALDAALADPQAVRAVMDRMAELHWPPSSAADWANFMVFDGITYYGRHGFGYRALPGESEVTEADLGEMLYRIAFKVGDRAGPGYHSGDGDAAGLLVGTLVYAVKGYSPRFRLAAAQRGQLTLFEASLDPDARTGADLLDIEGKVRAVAFYDAEELSRELASVDAPEAVSDIVSMVLAAPVDQGLRDTVVASYVVGFWLEDGTAVTRRYWPGSGLLERGIQLPPEFGKYLPAGG